MTSPWAAGAGQWRGLLVLLSMAVAVGGCGRAKPTLGTTRGHVTLQGKPVRWGVVVFEGADLKQGATAALGPDGAYEAWTQDWPGIAPGDYHVAILPQRIRLGGGMAADKPKPPAPDVQIPMRYRKSSTSDLKATVKPGANDPFDFDLVPDATPTKSK